VPMRYNGPELKEYPQFIINQLSTPDRREYQLTEWSRQ
jgi:hypothetical protein